MCLIPAKQTSSIDISSSLIRDTYLLLTAWGSWLLVWLPTLLSDILVTSLSSSLSLDVSSALDDAW